MPVCYACIYLRETLGISEEIAGKLLARASR